MVDMVTIIYLNNLKHNFIHPAQLRSFEERAVSGSFSGALTNDMDKIKNSLKYKYRIKCRKVFQTEKIFIDL